MIRSLRGILLLESILVSVAIVFVSGVAFYFLVRGVLVEQFDRSLIDYVLPLAASMEQKQDVVEADFNATDRRELDRTDRPAYLQIWLDDDAILFRSASLDKAELEPIPGTIESPGFAWTTLPDGRPGRAIGFVFKPREDGTKKRLRAEQAGLPWKASSRKVSLVFARETTAIDAPLRQIGFLLGGVSLAAILLSVGFLGWSIRRSLRPLNRLAGQIAALDGDDLSARIDPRGAPLEVEPVADRMNDFLRRLQTAFERERSFSADVAHELRTPLAGVRSVIEVAVSRQRSPGEYEAALQECRGITLQMQAMVEKLLFLARIEARQTPIDLQPVSLAQQLNAAWKPLDGVARAQGLRVEWVVEDDVEVLTDSALLGVVLHNLLENAAEYADRGGRVKIEATGRNGVAKVIVQNSGSQLSEAEAQLAFERFWRGDAAHSNTGVHCGLGLVLVKRITQALGGTAAIRSQAGGWFEIAITLPRATAAGSPRT